MIARSLASRSTLPAAVAIPERTELPGFLDADAGSAFSSEGAPYPLAGVSRSKPEPASDSPPKALSPALVAGRWIEDYADQARPNVVFHDQYGFLGLHC